MPHDNRAKERRSANWYNKADNIICVHRDPVEHSQDVDIHVQKIRFKHIGKLGVVTMKYDRVTARYSEVHSTAEAGRGF